MPCAAHVAAMSAARVRSIAVLQRTRSQAAPPRRRVRSLRLRRWHVYCRTVFINIRWLLEKHGGALLWRETDVGKLGLLTGCWYCLIGPSIVSTRQLLEEHGSIFLQGERDPGRLRLFTRSRGCTRARHGAAE